MNTMVSLTFDDGWKSTLDHAVPILDQANIKGTFYAIAHPPEKGYKKEQYATLQELKSLYEAGHEIGSHTLTHPHLTEIPVADMEQEITHSVAHFESQGILTNTFAYPYGQHNGSIIKIVQQTGFVGARSIRIGYNDKNTDRFRLKTQHVIVPVCFQLVKHWIHSAQRNQTWLILTFHQIEPTLLSLIKQRAIYGSTTRALQKIVDYLIYQNIDVVTVSDGVKKVFFNNKIPA